MSPRTAGDQRRQARPRSWLVFALGGAVALSGLEAKAQPSQSQRDEAARAFDEGVHRFDQADYVAAAQAFLRADELVANSDAIANAIAAARRASDHLLVVQAAERGIARAEIDPDLASKARLALAESVRHLSSLDMQCEPMPCELRFDGTPVDAGARYVLPGTHRMQATTSDGGQAEEVESLLPGTQYRIVLHPHLGAVQEATVTARRPDSSSDANRAVSSPPAGASDTARDEAHGATRGISPLWFYVGAGVTGVLVGATIWSGVDTLSTRADLGDRAPQTDIDHLRGKIFRTDVLLTASIVAGAATGYVGLFVVDWHETRAETGFSFVPGGTLLAARGRF